MMARHGVPLLADLRSSLAGEGRVDESHDVLCGTLTGLRRHTLAQGPAFDALVERLARLFDYAPSQLRHSHMSSAPVEITVELDRLNRALGAGGDPVVWAPTSLPGAIEYLPRGVPLGIYGRGPNWLYAALALLANPAPLWLFDVRLGWVQPPRIDRGQPGAALRVDVQRHAGHTRLDFSLPRAYVDYSEAQDLRVPSVPPDQGIVLAGKLPHWLLTGIALVYQDAPWLAVYQPQLDNAVVVHARAGTPAVGSVL
jgi:CRISPR-associated protein Csx3